MTRKIYALTSIPCFVLAVFAFAPPTSPPLVRIIRGRVVTVGASKGVAQVSARIPGSAVGTATSANGEYELRDVPAGATQLVFKHPCYYPVQVTIPGEGDVSVSIGLPFDEAKLRDAGCGGLGARKPDSTGATTH